MAEKTAKKEKNDGGRAYKELREALKNRAPKRLYVFYGEESFLREWCLGELRKLVARGTEEFNDRRFDGKTLSVGELADALDMVPMFSDFVLVEIHDFDFSKADEDTREGLARTLADIPEYMTVVFVCDTVEYKLDGRIASYRKLKTQLTEVEFAHQEESELVKWVKRHFKSRGKLIDSDAASYLVFITDGLMTTLTGEIEKLSSYVIGENVTRSDIDAVVTPSPDASAYKLASALFRGQRKNAAALLADSFAMDIPAQRLLYILELKAKNLLWAYYVRTSAKGWEDLKKLAGISFEREAQELFNMVPKLSQKSIMRLVTMCADTAYRLQSGAPGTDNEKMTELCMAVLREVG